MDIAAQIASVAGQSSALPCIQSAQTDKIDAAMCEVQAALVNPRPNATGVVQDGRGSRSYRYTTLDRIIDIARPELLRNKIVTLHPLIHKASHYEVWTILRHAPTGQYVGTIFPTMLTAADPAKLKGSITYARRTNLETLLNIATDDDRDAGDGQPDEAAPRAIGGVAGRPAPSGEGQREWLVRRGWEKTGDKTPALATHLLRAWHANADLADGLHAHHAGTRQDAEQLILATAIVLEAAFGIEFATAWDGIFNCRTMGALDAFRVRFDTELKPGIDAVRGQHSGAVAYLTQHLIAQAKRVEARAMLDDEVAQVEAQVAAPATETADDAVDADAAFLSAPAAPQPGLPAAPVIEDEYYPVIDAYGEPAGDETNDPVAFVSSYVSLWLAGDEEERRALMEHNDAALHWVGTFSEAAKLLETAMTVADDPTNMAAALAPADAAEDTPAAQPEPDPAWEGPLRLLRAVDVPTKRGGQPDLAAYLDALQNDLASVNDQPSMRAWLVANEPTYLAAGFPMGTRVRAMRMATERRMMLGMPPSAENE